MQPKSDTHNSCANTPNTDNDPNYGDFKEAKDRISKIKQRLKETPEASIPEFRFLKEEAYWHAAKFRPLDLEESYLAALSNLRSSAEFAFITDFLNPALTQYAQTHNGAFPTEITQLKPYFPSPVEDAILDRWMVAPRSTVRTSDFGDPIITLKAAVDADWDPRYAVGLKGFASVGIDTAGRNGWGVVSPDRILDLAAKAYQDANNGQAPSNPSQILPYLTTPEQQAAYQKKMKWMQKR